MENNVKGVNINDRLLYAPLKLFIIIQTIWLFLFSWDRINDSFNMGNSIRILIPVSFFILIMVLIISPKSKIHKIWKEKPTKVIGTSAIVMGILFLIAELCKIFISHYFPPMSREFNLIYGVFSWITAIIIEMVCYICVFFTTIEILKISKKLIKIIFTILYVLLGFYMHRLTFFILTLAFIMIIQRIKNEKIKNGIFILLFIIATAILSWWILLQIMLSASDFPL